jgi:anti-anti-sigma factor
MAEDTILMLTTPTEPFSLVHFAVRRRGGELVLAVRGEIDLSNLASLERELTARDREPRLVVDMTRVGFCSVAGARVLEFAAIRAAVVGQSFAVVESRAVARVLEMTGLADAITRVPARPERT